MDGSPCAGTVEPVDRLAVAAASFLPQLPSLVAMLAGTMAMASGALLVLRRFAGAIEAPPGPEAVLAVCGAGLVLVAAGDLCARSAAARAAGQSASQSVAWLPGLLTRLGLLMAMAAVILPLRMTSTGEIFTSVAAMIVSLVAVIRGPVAESIGGRLVQRLRAAAPRGRAAPMAAGEPSAAVPTADRFLSMPLQPASPPRFQEESLPPPTGNLLQRFERRLLPEGAECVRGRLCVAVPKGARSGHGHVGFCPPLASQPTVDVTTDYDGVEAIVSAAEVLPWGVRIECRLDEPAEEMIEIPVDIVATTPI